MLIHNRTIYLISGPLGVGKSSLSKMISQKLGFVLVDGDSFFVPLGKNEELSWKHRLRMSWDWIIGETRRHINNNKDVVIDFVVENELSFFLKKVSNLNVQVNYVALVANRADLIKRLKKRDGGTQYLERSIRLLDKLQSDLNNKPYLLDSTGKSTAEVFEEVSGDERFLIK